MKKLPPEQQEQLDMLLDYFWDELPQETYAEMLELTKRLITGLDEDERNHVASELLNEVIVNAFITEIEKPMHLITIPAMVDKIRADLICEAIVSDPSNAHLVCDMADFIVAPEMETPIALALSRVTIELGENTMRELKRHFAKSMGLEGEEAEKQFGYYAKGLLSAFILREEKMNYLEMAARVESIIRDLEPSTELKGGRGGRYH